MENGCPPILWWTLVGRGVRCWCPWWCHTGPTPATCWKEAQNGWSLIFWHNKLIYYYALKAPVLTTRLTLAAQRCCFYSTSTTYFSSLLFSGPVMHQTFTWRRLKEQQRWTRGRRKAASTKVNFCSTVGWKVEALDECRSCYWPLSIVPWKWQWNAEFAAWRSLPTKERLGAAFLEWGLCPQSWLVVRRSPVVLFLPPLAFSDRHPRCRFALTSASSPSISLCKEKKAQWVQVVVRVCESCNLILFSTSQLNILIN